MMILSCLVCNGQSRIVKDFTPQCDSLAELFQERSGVAGELKLKAVMKRGNALDFYFTESLGDFPVRKRDVRWFRDNLKSLYPDEYTKYKVGAIYSRKVPLDKLVTPEITFNGMPSESAYKVKNNISHSAIVEEIGSQQYNKGLNDRHIALWQSHGRYYEQSSERWEWQRPCLFQTCEDMFTQGFVLPYLVPMLENAGAYILMPRERDTRKDEVIVDNEPSYGGRGSGTYDEEGKWTDAGTGFADLKETYLDLENPFTTGKARQALCVGPSSRPTATVRWTPEIPERGRYAVYISYKSLPNSSTSAHYTVSHLGGTSEFSVNQKMGGGTWIYLGTFEFEKGSKGYVSLDNATPKGKRMDVGAAVTADAVRFGGGMGNIARSRWTDPEDSTSVAMEATVSGLPRSAEAARYWLQWAGADSTVYYQNEGKDDYKDDFMSRGDWVEWISRGSKTNPKDIGGLGIPVDLSFGFHTDAGVTPDDSIVGTLAIYTYKSEGKTKLPAGEDRMTGRMYADMVQSQIINDLQDSYDSLWTRRSIWDRSYRESRTPSSPAMLLELLSHQNFADMKFGLDPTFRFDVSRAVYKGMLKYMSSRYGYEYAVQPLPVESMAITFSEDRPAKALISWKAVDDPLEPTAKAKGFILYSRCGDGGFDNGIIIDEPIEKNGYFFTEADILPGKVYSFRIAAYNDGGRSFPSETVSIGIPAEGTDVSDKSILIVNNFDRVSGPAYFDTPSYAGFDNRLDSGVPYINDITFVGEMHEFRRDQEWISNDRPGFGASYGGKAGETVAGNSFDYPAVHGKAILEAGHPFYSCSNERFCADTLPAQNAWSIDLICGKQVTTKVGSQQKFTVFTKEMQKALADFTAKGGNLLVSGAYIGTDIADCIYPVQIDSAFRAESAKFAEHVLGYRFVTNQASRKGEIKSVSDFRIDSDKARFCTMMNPDTYCVESPDGIAPASAKGKAIYRYTDSGITAGVAYDTDMYKCISLGFPIEAMLCNEQLNELIDNILKYFIEND